MDPLQEAIRCAINEMPVAVVRRPSKARESLVHIATDAQAFVEETRTAMAAGAGGPRTERRIVAGALLAYALDIAWSICHLLRTEPVRTHIVVLTLWRPLLETWLRAAFFALEATEEEISAFRTAGTLPKRGWPSRPEVKTEITPRLIAKLIAPLICPQQPGLLDSLADEVKDWHGFVHGGDVVVDLFDGGDTLQSQVGPDHMAFKVQRVAVIALLTGLVGLNLSTGERQPEELDPLGAGLREKILAFQSRWPRPSEKSDAAP
ncbi:hypothetical protein [Stenotrophomonas rhizophila]|uniref:hypothetical protein n=1 Tax=Stenotrophomonas rhizophila TaxID=216778 RepID=UPI001E4CCB39|nr:hypothetical protein [Stenotrophomonas rhizophila]MCC7632596.1 hypothetical protein [Stenotrophomonas rhizophila]MCC7663448.1 hypothetical protein [Stenotrophomonas rhizophila]